MSEGSDVIYLAEAAPRARVAPSGPAIPFQPPAHAAQVAFDRRELSEILNIYGRMVAMGEWRDYAIGLGREAASFAIFRRASEMPIYRVVKQPKLRNKQGMFAVISATGHILKRGHSLSAVLRVFDRKLMRLVQD